MASISGGYEAESKRGEKAMRTRELEAAIDKKREWLH